jgi:hypothetical protein
MESTEVDAAYKRGMLDATVAEHSRHLEKINGTLETISGQMTAAANAMTIAAEKAAARDAIAVHTAQVVKDTRQEAIDKSQNAWLPWSRILVVLVALAALVGAYFTITHKGLIP